MRTRQTVIKATRGGRCLVSLRRHEYAVTVDVDDAQVLFKIKNRPWTVGHHVDDLAQVLDACRGALELMEGPEQEGGE